MKITYDLECLPDRKTGRKESEEVSATKLFLASQHKNMCLSYDKENQAKTRYNTLRKWRNENNLKGILDIFCKEKCIYVQRVEGKDRPSAAELSAGSSVDRTKTIPAAEAERLSRSG